MSTSTIWKTIGAVKDQTSIGIAKVASKNAPELEVAVVKATSHDDDPADEKYILRILNLTTYSRGYVHACIVAVSKRLGKTRDWIVALKTLVLIHRLLVDGNAVMGREIMYATRRGVKLLNMSDFRDEAHSNSWDHSAFVRNYAMYLDQKLELMAHERKSGGGSGSRAGPSGYGDDRYGGRDDFRSPPQCGYDYDYGGDYRGGNYRGNGGMTRRSQSYRDISGAVDERNGKDDKKAVTPLREMQVERIFGKMIHLQRLLDRLMSCRPTGLAKKNRLVLVALYPVVKESFQLYADVCEVLAVLLDKFFDMEYSNCVKAFDAYASVAQQIDELVVFYNWCKDTGVTRSSECPEIQRITSKLLDTLEEFVRDRAKKPKSPERKPELHPVDREEEPVEDMNNIKALPPPEIVAPPSPPPPEPKLEPPKPAVTSDLVDWRDDIVTADDQGNKLELALFAGPVVNTGNGSWEAFPSNGEPQVTSAWQNSAAEAGMANWELALVETASHLSRQKAALGGGFDLLLLNGMYGQGMLSQHTSTAHMSGGSTSSVALPGPGKTAPVLALPAPDGTVQTMNQDPFAASLSIPPPSYVQMAEIEKKQHFLVQEQQLWQQYTREGMQGQASMAKISGAGGYYVPGQMAPMTYGMPPVPGMVLPPGYYYPPY